MVLPVDVIPLRRCLALLWRLFAEQRRRGREVLSHGKGDELLINSEAERAAEPNSPYDELIALQALAAKEEEAEAALPHCCGTPCSPSIALTTAVFVMGAATMACAFPSVTVVFGLLGSTTSVTCMQVRKHTRPTHPPARPPLTLDNPSWALGNLSRPSTGFLTLRSCCRPARPPLRPSRSHVGGRSATTRSFLTFGSIRPNHPPHSGRWRGPCTR